MAHPPSYEDAIATADVVRLVCHYLDEASLITGSRVCSEWHIVMNTRLWSDPFAFVARGLYPFRKYVGFCQNWR
jgi:hypothetical protein